MFSIIFALRGTPQSRSRYDDDMADRINHRYTQALLIMFSIVVTTNQYVGDNIHCWVEAHFSDPWIDYTNQYCWIKNTFYVRFDEYLPKEHEPKRMIQYYQWVPLILLGQAFLFFLPCQFWRTVNDRAGVAINSVVEEGWTFYETETAGEKSDRMDRMVKHFHRFLMAKSHRPTGCTTSCKALIARIFCPVCGRHRGNYLSLGYLITKMLYLANSIGQLLLLDLILGYDYHFFGLHVLGAMLSGDTWHESGHFPRVTACDFKVRSVGNTQRYTALCALPVNLFNEKIFLFIWVWLVLITLMNILSLTMWILRFLFSADHERYIRSHLVDSPTYDHQKSGALRSFLNDYLKSDGVFVLRMIGHNVDGTSVNEFITALWMNYRRKDKGNNMEMEEIRPTTFDE